MINCIAYSRQVCVHIGFWFISGPSCASVNNYNYCTVAVCERKSYGGCDVPAAFGVTG